MCSVYGGLRVFVHVLHWLVAVWCCTEGIDLRPAVLQVVLAEAYCSQQPCAAQYFLSCREVAVCAFLQLHVHWFMAQWQCMCEMADGNSSIGARLHTPFHTFLRGVFEVRLQ